tara:strand:+ start:2061 stop:3686 length:1626 start_codon:yes stop_codon:yes gene_type:complete
MKNLYSILFILGLFAVTLSCTDLEEDLRGVITTNISVQGIATDTGGGAGADALEGAFSQLRNTGTGGHTNWYSAQELTSDEMVVTTKGGDWYDGGWLIDFHKHQYKSTNPSVNNNWNSHYGAVNACNELLAGGSLDANGTAQIRALRAYFFWRLMDLYGNIQLPTAPGASVAQSTRAEAFAFIESELLAALGDSDLSDGVDLTSSALGTAKDAYRLNQFGVLGIIAKLYLGAEVYLESAPGALDGTPHFNEAAAAAQYIIDNGGYALCAAGCKGVNPGKRPDVASDPDELEGFPHVFAPNNQGNVEHIWSVKYDAATAGGFNLAMMALHYSSQLTWNFDSQPWNGYSSLEAFYNSFTDGGTVDPRRDWSFIEGPQLDFGGNALLDYATDDGDPILVYTPFINEIYPDGCRECGVRPGKFSYSQFGRSSMDNDFTLIRLGQVHLIRGEALARAAGDWSLALDDVNALRNRVGLGPLAAMDADTFLKERGKEMFSEAVRRTDLIRFGKYGDTWWEKPASDGNKTIFPIPYDRIQEGLTQNPGY